MKQKVLVITHYPQECGAPYWCIIDAKTLLEIERVEKPYAYYHNVCEWIESDTIEQRPISELNYLKARMDGYWEVGDERRRIIAIKPLGEGYLAKYYASKLVRVGRELVKEYLDDCDYEDKDALVKFLSEREDTNRIQDILEFLRPQYEIVNNIQI